MEGFSCASGPSLPQSWRCRPYSLAQIQGRVQSYMHSSVQNDVFNRFHHRQKHQEQYQLGYPSSSCWRATRMPNGILSAWNCQPYPRCNGPLLAGPLARVRHCLSPPRSARLSRLPTYDDKRSICRSGTIAVLGIIVK